MENIMEFDIFDASQYEDQIVETVNIETIEDLKALQDKYNPKWGLVVEIKPLHHNKPTITLYNDYLE
jgi:hypothetical protein